MSPGSWLTAGPEQSPPAGKCSPSTRENYSLWATAPPAPPSPEEDDTYKTKANTAGQRLVTLEEEEVEEEEQQLHVREGSRDTDLKPWLSVTSDPLAPITRYCLLFWMSTALQVAFFTRSTCVPELTASNSTRDNNVTR